MKVKLFLENNVIITAMRGRRNSVWKPKNVLIDTEGLFIKECHGICLIVFFIGQVNLELNSHICQVAFAE